MTAPLSDLDSWLIIETVDTSGGYDECLLHYFERENLLIVRDSTGKDLKNIILPRLVNKAILDIRLFLASGGDATNSNGPHVFDIPIEEQIRCSPPN
jgi:hypothetical protein